MRNRGQAAIEFLVTYGWAILGVLIVISMLGYFGIFNTQRYVNDVCYFGDQMTCEDYILYNDSWTNVTLRNNFGVAVSINGVTAKSDYGTVSCLSSIPTTGNAIPRINIPASNTFELSCKIYNIAGARLPLNNKIRYRMIVEFNRTGSNNAHNQTGDLTVTVQKK